MVSGSISSEEDVDLSHFDEQEFEIPLVTCEWLECGQQFWELEPMIEHIHDAHIGVNRTKYSCEWTGCPRRGKVQTSRFALLSHIRSHTGEKPFICPRPECDKAFTRTDALQKHSRIQHSNNEATNKAKAPVPSSVATEGTSTPSKRRKLEDGSATAADTTTTTTKEEDEIFDDDASPTKASQSQGAGSAVIIDGTAPINDDDKETLDFFRQHPDMSPDYLRYVATLAKHEYLISEHEALLHELEILKVAEQSLVRSKDQVLNDLLRKRFGDQDIEKYVGLGILHKTSSKQLTQQAEASIVKTEST